MEERRILILGATSLIGRDIAELVASAPGARLRLGGRRANALAELAGSLGDGPGGDCEVRVCDVRDRRSLEAALDGAGLVVNCVGPYDLEGARVAESALRSGASYVDFAYEQAHFRACQGLDPLARERGLALIVGAGMISGSTTLFVDDALSRLAGLREIDILYAEGAMPDAESGFGSIVSGALEASSAREVLSGSRLVPFRIGSEFKDYAPPDRSSGNAESMRGLRVPSIDDIRYARPSPCLESIRTYLAMDVPTPGIVFDLIRALNPARRRLSYALFARISRGMIRSGYERQRRAGITRKPAMRLVATTDGGRYERTVVFSDSRNATSFIPALIARSWLRGDLEVAGLANAADILDLDSYLAGLKVLGLELAAGGWEEEKAP